MVFLAGCTTWQSAPIPLPLADTTGITERMRFTDSAGVVHIARPGATVSDGMIRFTDLARVQDSLPARQVIRIDRAKVHGGLTAIAVGAGLGAVGFVIYALANCCDMTSGTTHAP